MSQIWKDPRSPNRVVAQGGVFSTGIISDKKKSRTIVGYAQHDACTEPPGANRLPSTPNKIKKELDRLQNWFGSVRTRQELKK